MSESHDPLPPTDICTSHILETTRLELRPYTLVDAPAVHCLAAEHPISGGNQVLRAGEPAESHTARHTLY
jgi:hypothetical protein